MKAPAVTVCLPNLNTEHFLPKRFESTLSQTFTDWECIVVDNHSDDGSWEIIQSYAARDPRIKAMQAPRDPQGMYPNWNNCIRRARGEYIYIATSDDTMTPDCLELMVGALERNPGCGICHSDAAFIDEHGEVHPEDGWSAWNDFAPEWTGRSVIRKAPHDGLLHCALRTIYTSITGLLIRREVFERIGLFDGSWGSRGDFEWEMRASLLYDVVYLPERLSGWRRHPDQATKEKRDVDDARAMVEMASTALQRAMACDPELRQRLKVSRCLEYYRDVLVGALASACPSTAKRLALLATETLRGNPRVATYFSRRMRRLPVRTDDARAEARRLLEVFGCTANVSPAA
jgi:glycosyltransferase involved in cell wall biosynthesis